MSEYQFFHFTDYHCQQEIEMVTKIYQRLGLTPNLYSGMIFENNEVEDSNDLMLLAEQICHKLNIHLNGKEHIIPCISISLKSFLIDEHSETFIDILISRIAEFYLSKWPNFRAFSVPFSSSCSEKTQIVIFPSFVDQDELEEDTNSKRIIPDYNTPFSLN